MTGGKGVEKGAASSGGAVGGNTPLGQQQASHPQAAAAAKARAEAMMRMETPQSNMPFAPVMNSQMLAVQMQQLNQRQAVLLNQMHQSAQQSAGLAAQQSAVPNLAALGIGTQVPQTAEGLAAQQQAVEQLAAQATEFEALQTALMQSDAGAAAAAAASSSAAASSAHQQQLDSIQQAQADAERVEAQAEKLKATAAGRLAELDAQEGQAGGRSPPEEPGKNGKRVIDEPRKATKSTAAGSPPEANFPPGAPLWPATEEAGSLGDAAAAPASSGSSAAASATGNGKTGTGVTPDANGRIKIDIPGGGDASGNGKIPAIRGGPSVLEKMRAAMDDAQDGGSELASTLTAQMEGLIEYADDGRSKGLRALAAAAAGTPTGAEVQPATKVPGSGTDYEKFNPPAGGSKNQMNDSSLIGPPPGLALGNSAGAVGSSAVVGPGASASEAPARVEATPIDITMFQ